MLIKPYLKLSLLLILFSCTFILCKPTPRESTKTSLQEIVGITFIETRREFDTGYSFSGSGFQQVPEWVLYFLPGDSVKIYSPFEKKYIFYPIYFDHKNVVNFAREWLRIKYAGKDSLVLQLLNVQAKKINRERSNVYMKFYSENYIKNVLHADPDSLKRPTRKDTLFIQAKVQKANRYPYVSDSVFSARNPVQFVSRSIDVKVEKVKASDNINSSKADDYLYPEYYITINNAHKDFSESYTAFVNQAGQVFVSEFAVLDEEFRESRRRVLQGISDVYLERFLTIIPGNTLGIPHTSEILLHIKGIKYPAN